MIAADSLVAGMDRVTPAALSALLDRLPDLVTVLDAGGMVRF
jgi:hypothetical protein